MNKVRVRFGEKTLRLSLAFFAAALIALSASDSRARPETNDGFLFSHYLQSQTSHQPQSPTLQSPTSHRLQSPTLPQHSQEPTSNSAFSVSNANEPFWHPAVQNAQSAVNELTFEDYLADQLINDGDSAALRAGQQLQTIGWQLGADIIERGAFSAGEQVFGKGLKQLKVDVNANAGKGLSNVGIDAIGALHHTKRSALAWQARAYVGFEDSRRGFNIGGIARTVGGKAMLGANTFLDYETFDGEAFSRWSSGVEMRTRSIDVFANYYQAITDPLAESQGNALVTGASVIRTYSADGYDVEAHFRNYKSTEFTGIIGYYAWLGEFEQDDETGLLFGARWAPTSLPLVARVDYRSGVGKDFGGQLAYVHEFGRDNSNDGQISRAWHSPQRHFFEPVQREYTQRISKVTTNDSNSSRQINQLTGSAILVGNETTPAAAASRGESPSNHTPNLTLDLHTDLELTGTGDVMVIRGTLQNRVITEATVSLPWTMPPAVSLRLETVGSVPRLAMSQTAGVRSHITIYNNAEVTFGDGVLDVQQGRADVSADAGFILRAPSAGVAGAFGNNGGNTNVNVGSNNAGGVVFRGQFRLTVGVSTFIGAGDGSVSVSFNSRGGITRTTTNGEMIRVIGQDGTVVTLAPINVRVTPSQGLSGSGEVFTPILVNVGYAGVIATVVANGGQQGNPIIFPPVSQGPLEVIAGGLINAPARLTPGRHLIAVRIQSGNEFKSQVVYVRVSSTDGSTPPITMTMDTTMTMTATATVTPPPPPVLTFSALGGLTGNGTSNSPFVVFNGHTGMIAALQVANGLNNVSYSFAASVSGSLTLNTAGVVSAAESLTTATTESFIVVALANSSPALTATLYVEVMPPGDPLLGVIPATGLQGAGTSSATPITVNVGHNAVIATVRVQNPADNVDYTFAANTQDSLEVDVAGVVSAESVLSTPQTGEIEVVALANLTAALTTTVHVQVFAPLLATINTNNNGEGPADSPIELVREFDGVIGTVALVNTITDVTYTYASANDGALTVDATGGEFGATEALTVGVYTLPVTVSDGESSVLELTVHITVLNFNLSVSPVAGVTGDGTETSPYELRLDDIANGAQLLNITPANGFNDDYEYSVEGTVFGFADGAGDSNALVVNAVGLLEESRYTITMSVETEDTGGNTESIISTLHFSTQNIPVLPVIYTDPGALYSGKGTEDDPFLLPAPLPMVSDEIASISRFSGGYRYGGAYQTERLHPNTTEWNITGSNSGDSYNFTRAKAVPAEGERTTVVAMVTQSGRQFPVTVYFEASPLSVFFVTRLPVDNDGKVLTGEATSGNVPIGKIVASGGALSGYTFELSSQTSNARVPMSFNLVGDDLSIVGSFDYSFQGLEYVAEITAKDGTSTVILTVSVMRTSNAPFMLEARTTDFRGLGTEDFPIIIDHVSDLEVGVTIAQVRTRNLVGSELDSVYSTDSSHLALAEEGTIDYLVVTLQLEPGTVYEVPITVVNATSTASLTVYIQVRAADVLRQPPSIELLLFTGVVDGTDPNKPFHADCTTDNADICVANANQHEVNTNLIQFTGSSLSGNPDALPTWVLSGPDAGNFVLDRRPSGNANLNVGNQTLGTRVYELTVTITDPAGYSTSIDLRLRTAL